MAETAPNRNSQAAGPAAPKTPRFLVEQRPWAQSFFSSLIEYLTEKPVKIREGTGAPFTQTRFGAGFGENFKEWMKGGAAAPLPKGQRMLVEERPFFQVIWDDIRYAIAPPKLPPLKLTSKPIPVKPIWSKDENYSKAQVLSLATHGLAIALLTMPLVYQFIQNSTAPPVVSANVKIIDISPYLPKLPPGADKAGGGGGGGERMNTPPSKGRLPKFSLTQLTPPVATIRNPNPKLPAEQTVVVPPDIRVPQPNISAFGDPLAAMVTGSGGPGGGGGIGTGCCGGVGSGSGPGVGPGEGGGIGGGVYRPGRGGVGYPECAYCPDPRFSDEARKAKYQGTVLLRIIVLPDGRATNIGIVKGLGMGLDENAIEAVKGWRFKPAIGPGGKAVPVEVMIEVTFRLL
ncbi:MAG: energy transducer TonB [Acidobacteria bacterium]|nr:energy transducer TonB [Acidobacteriota bacterium]MCL5287128.1 energy transducer TonB [Acidobacteriota bacterium]